MSGAREPRASVRVVAAMKRLLPAALVLALAACQQSGPAPREQESAAAELASEAAPAPSATPTAEVVAPATPSASRDPAEVLARWAQAVELRDWKTVRSYWGEAGARSGMDEAAFAAKWSDLIAPAVTVGPGSREGAAGSLYYTAPVTITDGDRRIGGAIVLRRANDVPGATPEQLRWHIESTMLAW